MSLEAYFDYASQVAETGGTRIAAEETPLYLFDQEFGTKVPEMEAAFKAKPRDAAARSASPLPTCVVAHRPPDGL